MAEDVGDEEDGAFGIGGEGSDVGFRWKGSVCGRDGREGEIWKGRLGRGECKGEGDIYCHQSS